MTDETVYTKAREIIFAEKSPVVARQKILSTLGKDAFSRLDAYTWRMSRDGMEIEWDSTNFAFIFLEDTSCQTWDAFEKEHNGLGFAKLEDKE